MAPAPQNKPKGKPKRDGTPEKTEEEISAEAESIKKRNVVLFDESIAALQITEEDLNLLTQNKTSKVDNSTSSRAKEPVKVAVCREIPEYKREAPTKRMGILKHASPDAPIKAYSIKAIADSAANGGPRFDDAGFVVAHSLLGSAEEFYEEALRRGDMQLDEVPVEFRGGVSSGSDSAKLPVKHVRPADKMRSEKRYVRKFQHEESSALDHWQRSMHERKRQQGYISKLLQRQPEKMVMNAGDLQRVKVEDRHLIDRTIPYLDYGKGFRVGSEFWHQREPLGPELGGIHMTLTKTQQGYPPSIERIGYSWMARLERGVDWEPTSTPRYPWKTPYYKARKAQLQPIMDELNERDPDFNRLLVEGQRLSTACKEAVEMPVINGCVWRPHSATGDVRALSRQDQKKFEKLSSSLDDTELDHHFMSGPALLLDGKAARWTGDSYSFESAIGLESRVLFETQTNTPITKLLEMHNQGTSVLYYDWKKLPKKNPFDLVVPNRRRFYFNCNSGVLLPGQTLQFPFIFKSEKAGLFTEQWQLQTRPVLCGGAAILVTLHGSALQEDFNLRTRSEIEYQLQSQAAERIARSLLEQILAGIQIRERPKTPIDRYITSEEIFSRANPDIFYTSAGVQQLRGIFLEAIPEEERAYTQWDLSVQTIRKAIGNLNDDDPKKEELSIKLQKTVDKLCFQPALPCAKLHNKLYQIGYRVWMDTLDHLYAEWNNLRSVNGLPDLEQEFPDPAESRKKGGKEVKAKGAGATAVKETKTAGGTAASNRSNTTLQKEVSNTNKVDPKAKQLKSATSGSTRVDFMQKMSSAIPTHDSSSRAGSATSLDRSQLGTPQPDSLETIVDRRTHAALHVLTYGILCEMTERVVALFESAVE